MMVLVDGSFFFLMCLVGKIISWLFYIGFSFCFVEILLVYEILVWELLLNVFLFVV